MKIKKIIDGLQRGDCQKQREAKKEAIRILAAIDNIKAEIKAKAKLFDYLCVVQQLSNVQIHHNIQRNRIPENTSRPPGIHLC